MYKRQDCIAAPIVGSFKGNPTISLPTGDQGYPFSFGLKKAQAIIKHYELIKAFVEGHETNGGRSMAITFSSGETIYQNENGRCEDAPCCGCCS